MKNYIRPKIESFSSIDLTESIGPTQAASMTLEGYKGAYLHKDKEYRYCEMGNNVTKIAKIYNIKKLEVTENA